MSEIACGVEKVLLAKFAKQNRARMPYGGLSVFLDIFYPPIFVVWKKMEFFNSNA
jgi:hypothetical protein